MIRSESPDMHIFPYLYIHIYIFVWLQCATWCLRSVSYSNIILWHLYYMLRSLHLLGFFLFFNECLSVESVGLRGRQRKGAGWLGGAGHHLSLGYPYTSLFKCRATFSWKSHAKKKGKRGWLIEINFCRRHWKFHASFCCSGHILWNFTKFVKNFRADWDGNQATRSPFQKQTKRKKTLLV